LGANNLTIDNSVLKATSEVTSTVLAPNSAYYYYREAWAWVDVDVEYDIEIQNSLILGLALNNGPYSGYNYQTTDDAYLGYDITSQNLEVYNSELKGKRVAGDSKGYLLATIESGGGEVDIQESGLGLDNSYGDFQIRETNYTLSITNSTLHTTITACNDGYGCNTTYQNAEAFIDNSTVNSNIDIRQLSEVIVINSKISGTLFIHQSSDVLIFGNTEISGSLYVDSTNATIWNSKISGRLQTAIVNLNIHDVEHLGGISNWDGDDVCEYTRIDNVTITNSILIVGTSLDFTNSSVSSSLQIYHKFVNMTNITIGGSLNIGSGTSTSLAYLNNVTSTGYLDGAVRDLRLEDVHTIQGAGTLRVSNLWMSNSTFEKSSGSTDSYSIYVSDLDNHDNPSTEDIYIYNSTIRLNTTSDSSYGFVFDIDTTGDIRIIDSEINATRYRTSTIKLEGSEVLIQNSTIWSGARVETAGTYTYYSACSYKPRQCAIQSNYHRFTYVNLTLGANNLTIDNSVLKATSEVTSTVLSPNPGYYFYYREAWAWVDVDVEYDI
jgi:hypothetical protein